MKKKIISTKLSLILLVLLTGVQSFGQETLTLTMTNSKSHVIKSGFNKKQYRVRVLLPKSYATSDSIHYPVLYVLDGKYSTTSFYSLIETFALGKELKEMIIVTIDAHVKSESEWLTNRYTDLTPSSHPPTDTAIARYFKLPVVPSGGASGFLTTIEKDILPFIDHKYKTNKERALFGHSLGGLFVAYCLLTKPALYQKYSMNSPSLWWKNGEMTALPDPAATGDSSLKASVFFSAGSLEGNFIIEPLNKFIKSLKGNFPNLNVTGKIFEEETHLSVVHAASSRTLKVFYSQ